MFGSLWKKLVVWRTIFFAIYTWDCRLFGSQFSNKNQVLSMCFSGKFIKFNVTNKKGFCEEKKSAKVARSRVKIF
jgi:hypothetical protein